jgi:hypothetical protein
MLRTTLTAFFFSQFPGKRPVKHQILFFDRHIVRIELTVWRISDPASSSSPLLIAIDIDNDISIIEFMIRDTTKFRWTLVRLQCSDLRKKQRPVRRIITQTALVFSCLAPQRRSRALTGQVLSGFFRTTFGVNVLSNDQLQKTQFSWNLMTDSSNGSLWHWTEHRGCRREAKRSPLLPERRER